MKEPNHQYIAGLVLRAQQADSNAFTEIYALTYNKVYNYTRHYLKDDYLAQDAMQEVYISVLKNICMLKDPTLFIAWLNQIAFHVCYDISRKFSDKNHITDPELLEIIQDDHVSSNPEIHTEKLDESLQLRKALNALPFQEREIIVMRFFNNMKLEDIADALNISRSTVKRYIASAKNHLQKYLQG